MALYEVCALHERPPGLTLLPRRRRGDRNDGQNIFKNETVIVINPNDSLHAKRKSDTIVITFSFIVLTLLLLLVLILLVAVINIGILRYITITTLTAFIKAK